MTDEEFERAVIHGIESLPEWVRASITNVAFLIKDEPSEETHSEHRLDTNETLFGLYEGTPLTERGNESPLLPDTITIFKNPIFFTYTSEEDIRTCIENTVWHEVAHYFGHDEEWVETEEVRRGKVL